MGHMSGNGKDHKIPIHIHILHGLDKSNTEVELALLSTLRPGRSPFSPTPKAGAENKYRLEDGCLLGKNHRVVW
jgi:hypothetical protein